MSNRPYTDGAGWMWRAAGVLTLLAWFAVVVVSVWDVANPPSGLPPAVPTGTTP